MGPLLVIDGNNLLFQMFYGMPSPVYSKSGKCIHATIGFISFVLKQVRLLGADGVCVVFDSDTSAERHEILPEYKANRIDDWDSMDENEIPFSEEENIVKCLRFLGIKPVYSVGMEADDVIATAAKRYGNCRDVIISSFDSDFFQLINDHVSVLRYRGKASVMWNRAYFLEKYGFEPEHYALWKSVVGDKSDNIPGVPGIGEKRGALLMKEYALTGKLKGECLTERLRKSLSDNMDTVERNLKLIKLSERTEVVFDEPEFSFDREKMALSNSEVLSACAVFD
ncbi:MAG: 5'-3' exonuclease H3TH domain-containing protein [Bullifex sp.]